MWPSIDLQNQENIIVVFQSVIKAKESEGKYSFGNNIIFEIIPTIYFNFNKYLIRIIFLCCFTSFANFAGPKFTKFVRTLITKKLGQPDIVQHIFHP